jgi:hypothetical protein
VHGYKHARGQLGGGLVDTLLGSGIFRGNDERGAQLGIEQLVRCITATQRHGNGNTGAARRGNCAAT